MTAIVLCGSCASQLPPSDQTGTQLRIAAAADLKFALDDVIAEFIKRHPEVSISATYGASGNIYSQIRNRAPFDLFLSADLKYPTQLAEEGFADRDSIFIYSHGKIVLWIRNDSGVEINRGLSALLNPEIKKIAIANPRHAPYGQAAHAALESEELYERVEAKLVFGENVSQAAQFVESGAADAGIIALSLAEAPVMKDKGRYHVVALESYPALQQAGAILSGCKNRAAAEQFCKFLQSEDGQETLHRFGFQTLGD